MIKNCGYCSHVDECEKDYTRFNKYACGIPCDNWYPNDAYKIEEFDYNHEALWRCGCDTVDAVNYIYDNLNTEDPVIRKLLSIIKGRNPNDECYKRIGGY